MPAISDVGARRDAFPLLSSVALDTNELLRQRALRLVTHGVSQKVLAAKMGMQPSTFSRWLNQKESVGPVSVTALDGFNAYVRELTDALTDRATIPAAIRQVSVPLTRKQSSQPERSHAARKKKGR